MRRQIATLAICAALTACAPDPQVERARADAAIAQANAAQVSALANASQAAAFSDTLTAQSSQIGALVDTVISQADSWRIMAGMLAVGMVLIMFAATTGAFILARRKQSTPPAPVIYQIMQPMQPTQLQPPNEWPNSQRHREAIMRALVERQAALPAARQIEARHG